MTDIPPRPVGGTGLDGRRRISAEDLVYVELRDLLAQQRLAPGNQVSEESLAVTLGVSRTPLRQALGRLRHEGLVERSANGRLYVAPMSADDAMNLFSVRIALELLALEQSFVNLTEELLVSLRGLLAQMAVIEQGSERTVGRYGSEFHAALYRNSRNDVNLGLLSALEGRIDRYRFLSTGTGVPRQRHAVEEHQVILEALEQRNLRATKRALREHLENARKSVLTALSNLAETKGPTGS